MKTKSSAVSKSSAKTKAAPTPTASLAELKQAVQVAKQRWQASKQSAHAAKDALKAAKAIHKSAKKAADKANSVTTKPSARVVSPARAKPVVTSKVKLPTKKPAIGKASAKSSAATRKPRKLATTLMTNEPDIVLDATSDA